MHWEYFKLIHKIYKVIAYKLKMPKGTQIHKVVHVCLQKPFKTVTREEPQIDIDNDENIVLGPKVSNIGVEGILDSRRIRRKKYYIKGSMERIRNLGTFGDAKQLPKKIQEYWWQFLEKTINYK